MQAELRDSLRRAGIGRAYHDRSLTEIPAAAPLVEWLRGPFKQDLYEGRGWTVIGDGLPAKDAAMLLSRSVHLMGQQVRVVPLVRLISEVARPGDLMSEIQQARCLVLTDVFQQYGTGDCPYTGWQVASAEAFLGDWLDDQKPLLVHAAKRLAGTWWSASFAASLARANTTIEIA
ncbi:hypothetical protein [Azospirillum argentinense]|uniref:hypothetical protein n=1 Tax=Azospirillum argentinense TaxID=2970906 RepID=UPI0032DE35EF